MRITKDTSIHIGETYDRLTVLEYSHFKQYAQTRRYYYKCSCSCGGFKIVAIDDLKSKHSSSCGCLHKELRRLSDGESSRNRVIGAYKSNARNRNIEFSLTDDETIKLITMDCHYCGDPPSNMTKNIYNTGDFIYNGIDRVDNSKGYEFENCVPCCKYCNLGKRDMSEQDFFTWVEKVYKKSCAD